MSYETVIEKVRSVPEERLSDVENFIDSLSQGDAENFTMQKIVYDNIPASKQAFFDAIGKISFDKEKATRFREMERNDFS